MIMTQEDRDRLKNYFKYYCGTRQIQSSIKLILIFIAYLVFVGYVFIFNKDILNMVQTVFYGFGVMLCLSVMVKEVMKLVELLYYFSDKYIDENMTWEEGRIKHLELGKLGVRVVVTDNIGDPYIAYYAEELVEDLFEDGLPKEIQGCIVYLKNKKKEYITAYPYKYLDSTKV